MSEPEKEAPRNNQLKPIDLIRKDLDGMQPQFKLVLPSHIPPERFVRVALTAFQQNEDLLKTDKKILIAELMKCATDGLIPDGREAAMVPFKAKGGVQKARYMPMITGIVKRLHQAGGIKSITTHVVFKNDFFEYWIDELGEHIKHKPKLDGDRGDVLLTYSMVTTTVGGCFIEVVTEDDMDLIRAASKGENTPWNGDFEDEMRKKSALRRNSKKLPLGYELLDLLSRDNDIYDFNPSQPSADELPPMQAQSLDDAPINPQPSKQPMKDVNQKPDAKHVWNAAPGAVNHPDAKPPPPKPAPEPKKVDPRPALAKEFWALCKELGIDASEKIGEIFQKDAAKLTAEEYSNLIDLVKAEKIKKEQK